MKHVFLLDMMILYHAVKVVDEKGNPDTACADLLRLIAQNCHSVSAHAEILERYWRHIRGLAKQPPLQTQTSLFIAQFLANERKLVREESELPELPPEVTIPREDQYLVRAALISKPIVVTREERLLRAINSQIDKLGLRALRPEEALQLAREPNPPESCK